MAFSSMARHTVAILRTPLVTDRHGRKFRDWRNGDVERAEINGCLVQPVSSSEAFESSVAQYESRWRIFAPRGSDIRADDRIEFDGLVFEVDGPAMRRTSLSGRIDHVEAILKRAGDS